MRSLFWKGMLAFVTVILVTVGTVAILAGWITEAEFRRYAVTHGGMWNTRVEELAAFYASHGSWQGVEATLEPLGEVEVRGRGWGGGQMGPGMMGGMMALDFRLADAEGQVVADTQGNSGGQVSQSDMASALPVEVDGRVVGYLIPSAQSMGGVLLDAPQAEFLRRVRTTLSIATAVALAVALVVGGLLFRSIVAPLRQLTVASQAIAEGNLSARAPVQGRDEVAQLSHSFNQMAESLDQAETARRNQTADVAHELRTPITVLQGTLEAMLDGVYPIDQENLQAASAQVRTLSRLVEDLRTLALADAGRLELYKVPLDMGSVLQEAVDAHRLPAQEQGVTLELERPRSLPLVLADRDRLAQVMGNLLGNGLRYVPAGGRLLVRVVDEGREVRVSVVDNGSGVPESDLPRLFERFWRGDTARRQAAGGSGLGLAIARYIIEKHGGRIWAEPTPGGGLTVTFSFPTAALA